MKIIQGNERGNPFGIAFHYYIHKGIETIPATRGKSLSA